MLKATICIYEGNFMHPLIWLSSQLQNKGNERFFRSQFPEFSPKERCECYDRCFPFGARPGCGAVLRPSNAWDFFVVNEWPTWIATPGGAWGDSYSCTGVFCTPKWWQNSDFEALKYEGSYFGSVLPSLLTLTVPAMSFGLVSCSGWSMQRAMSTLSIRPLHSSDHHGPSRDNFCILLFNMWNIKVVDGLSKLVFVPYLSKFHTSLIISYQEVTRNGVTARYLTWSRCAMSLHELRHDMPKTKLYIFSGRCHCPGGCCGRRAVGDCGAVAEGLEGPRLPWHVPPIPNYWWWCLPSSHKNVWLWKHRFAALGWGRGQCESCSLASTILIYIAIFSRWVFVFFQWNIVRCMVIREFGVEVWREFIHVMLPHSSKEMHHTKSQRKKFKRKAVRLSLDHSFPSIVPSQCYTVILHLRQRVHCNGPPTPSYVLHDLPLSTMIYKYRQNCMTLYLGHRCF